MRTGEGIHADFVIRNKTFKNEKDIMEGKHKGILKRLFVSHTNFSGHP